MNGAVAAYEASPWHFLYFRPLPHGQGSLRPTFRGTDVWGADKGPIADL